MKEYSVRPMMFSDEEKTLDERGGYPCPVCGAAVHITMHRLLEGKCVICPECGFRIDFNAKAQAADDNE